MASNDETAAAINIAMRMCDRARLIVGRSLESGTLRRALHCRVNATRNIVEAILSVPHYWAIYYHDGRGEIRAKKGKVLVWFASIEDDPRVNVSGHPRRVSQRVKLNLSKSEFRRLRKAGKLIVSKRSGPAEGKPFYNVLFGLGGQVGDIAVDEVGKILLDGLRRDKTLHMRETLTFNFF